MVTFSVSVFIQVEGFALSLMQLNLNAAFLFFMFDDVLIFYVFFFKFNSCNFLLIEINFHSLHFQQMIFVNFFLVNFLLIFLLILAQS